LQTAQGHFQFQVFNNPARLQLAIHLLLINFPFDYQQVSVEKSLLEVEEKKNSGWRMPHSLNLTFLSN
jgi:hypothetical protein